MEQIVHNAKIGRLECVFVNLEAVYSETGNLSVERSFEELRAQRRGWLEKRWERPRRKQPTKPHAPRFERDHDVQLDIQPQQDTPIERETDKPAEHRKPKQRGFQIFEDLPAEAPQPIQQVDEANVMAEKFSKTLSLNDENDENAPPPKQDVDLAKRLRREERANRTRKIQVMDVKHIKNETKTIQLNLDSPNNRKVKRKKSTERAEPTMTINTKEAMDEIYGIFNQPLPSQMGPAEAEEEDSDDDYSTGDESTATGKLSATASDYGDETRNELLGARKSEPEAEETRVDATGWSDFTASKHVPRDTDSLPDAAVESAQSTRWEVYQDPDRAAIDEPDELLTPHDEENAQTRYVPVPPEDYESSSRHPRDLTMLPNHRLPFMTPIVEQTESSLGTATVRTEKDYFTAKTPSRTAGMRPPSPEDDAILSSPFQDVTAELAEEKRRVLQPIRTKSTKGTISLGQGSAKSQIAAKSKAPGVAEPPVQKGPVIKDEQCNPMDPELRQTILSEMKPPLSSYEGYHEHLDAVSGRSAEIRKYVKTLAKASRSSVNLDKTAQMLSCPPTLAFPGAEGPYTVRRELGAGTFAPVYLVENVAATEAREGADDEARPTPRVGRAAHRKLLEAVKMEDPPSTWEFYMLRQSHRRLGVSRAAESIVRAHEMHLYRDECFLVEEYREQGTLLDLVNVARLDGGNSGGMDEMLAMWLTVELLRTVEALHGKGLIHGDLKGDNVLMRFDDPGQETDWSPTFFPSGAHGWASKGICLIDFGRGIDLRQFVPQVAFVADWKTSEADCAEMRELRPWTYQIDYHGLAGVVHSLLFGKYMECVGEKGGALGQGATKTYRIRESLKRYWQTEIWGELFALLLNPLAHLGAEEGRKMPVLKGMRGCRERMEAWLEEHCERGVGLKGMITRMEVALREKRRKSIKA